MPSDRCRVVPADRPRRSVRRVLTAVLPGLAAAAGLALFVYGDLASDRILRAAAVVIVGLALVAAAVRLSSWR